VAISAPRINYRNAHAPNTSYQLGDIVDWNGERRICASAHTSVADPNVINSYFIHTGILGLTERGVWAASTANAVGDVVTASYARWYCEEFAHVDSVVQ